MVLSGMSTEILRFEAWTRKHPDLTPYRTEWSIFDPQMLVAGQVDALWFLIDANRSDAIVMSDWKRSKQILTGDVEIQRKQAYGEKRGVAKREGCEVPGPCSDMYDCTYNHYLIQQNLYAHILRHYYDHPLSALWLVQCHPEVGTGDDDYKEVELANLPDLAQTVLDAYVNGGWGIQTNVTC